MCNQSSQSSIYFFTVERFGLLTSTKLLGFQMNNQCAAKDMHVCVCVCVYPWVILFLYYILYNILMSANPDGNECSMDITIIEKCFTL